MFMCLMGLDVFCLTGKQLLLHCDACADSEDITLIYWLVNGLFPEDTHSDGRITELEE